MTTDSSGSRTSNLTKLVFSILLLTTVSLISLGATELFLRFLGYKPALYCNNYYENNNICSMMSVEPDSFFVSDPDLGWKLREGCYTIKFNDKFAFGSCIDITTNRIIPIKQII
jgi:hypothetical protein